MAKKRRGDVRFPRRPERAVAVFGHGDFFRDACGLDFKPANNAVLKRRVVVENGVVRAEATCGLFLRGVPRPAALSRGDVARCSKPFDVYPFLDLGPSECAEAPPKALTFPDEEEPRLARPAPPPEKVWYGQPSGEF